MSDASEFAAREVVARRMIAHGYATGHGDTLDDLLGEIEAQASRRLQEADVDRVAAALREFVVGGGDISPDEGIWTALARAAIAAMSPQNEGAFMTKAPLTPATGMRGRRVTVGSDNNDGTRILMSQKTPAPVEKPPATPLSERSLEALRRPWKPGDGL